MISIIFKCKHLMNQGFKEMKYFYIFNSDSLRPLPLNQVNTTMKIVMLPPNKTDGIVPIILAAIPLSAAPNSLLEEMNMELTAVTLDFMVSGVCNCRMVARIMTLTLSKTPHRNSIKKEK